LLFGTVRRDLGHLPIRAHYLRPRGLGLHERDELLFAAL
jgi:hypothetical protein